jgi:hypothetical protein
MSFRSCVDDAQRANEITEDQANEVRDLFDELEAEYQGRMSGAQAQAQAGLDAFNAIRQKAAVRKRQKAMQLRTWQQISKNLKDYRDLGGNENEARAALALFEQDGLSRFSSVLQREEAIKGEAFGEMSALLASFRRNLVGEVRQKAKLDDVVREIFGQATGNKSARELASAWNTTSENLRKRFNAAGGAIVKRSDWGMPQNHDMISVRKAGYTEWRDFILPRLNRQKMIDEQTGIPFSDEKFELVMRDVYETISNDGINKLQPGGVGQSKSFANRRQDHRFLTFRDADSWLEYQKKFGNANSFDTMISHVSNMSRDIAMMEILGPNPTATLNFLKQTLVKNAQGNEKAQRAADRASKRIDDFYMSVTGKNNSPVDGMFAATFAGTRQLLQAAQLGAASISAITDLNFGRIARGFVGLPQVNTVSSYLKYLSPLNAKEKGELAIRMGLIAEGWTSLAAGQMRYVGDVSGPEITRRISDFVMRASFLSPMTSAGRWSFGMEFLGFMASESKKSFDQLDPVFRKTLDRYGFGSDSWDNIRSTELYDYQGAKFLRPADIKSRTDLQPALANELTTRVLEMINTETNFAVPSTSMRGRVALTGETRPGSASGEFLRSFAMYKNFGVTLVNTHLFRGASQPGVKGKGVYFADLIISATVMGALALQLKEMSKGRDPRPMNTEEFWGAAFLQGGGFGIFGDFLFSNVNRFGGGLAETAAGPVIGLLEDLRSLTVGNLLEVASGEDTKAGAELIRFAKDYTPGSSIWYARLALERLLWDQMQLWADPKARQKIKRLERKYKRDYGQSYWWGPGDLQPSRKPDLESALGN